MPTTLLCEIKRKTCCGKRETLQFHCSGQNLWFYGMHIHCKNESCLQSQLLISRRINAHSILAASHVFYYFKRLSFKEYSQFYLDCKAQIHKESWAWPYWPFLCLIIRSKPGSGSGIHKAIRHPSCFCWEQWELRTSEWDSWQPAWIIHIHSPKSSYNWVPKLFLSVQATVSFFFFVKYTW